VAGGDALDDAVVATFAVTSRSGVADDVGSGGAFEHVHAENDATTSAAAGRALRAPHVLHAKEEGTNVSERRRAIELV
jgi:hypothetical protein